MSDSARARSGSAKGRMRSNCFVIAEIRPPAWLRFVFTKDIQKVKKVCAYSPRTCCCSRSLFLVFSVMLKSCLMQLYVGPCQVVSAVMAVPIENSADCEVRDVIRFLQADGISGYLAEETSSRVELFCCTTMHVRILPGRHRPCCMSNSIGTSSSILRTIRTWQRRTCSCFKNLRCTLLANSSKWWRPEGFWLNNQVATWYEEIIPKLAPRYDKCLNVKADYVGR